MIVKELSEERIEQLKLDYERGFIKFCGFRAVEAHRGRFVSKVTINEDHRQQDGFIHAGVMATMADHTAGYAGFTIVNEGIQILTIEFKINFLRPAAGNELRCSSRVIREGKRVIIGESEVYDVRGKGGETMAAKAMVTLMAVPGEDLRRASTEKKAMDR